MTHDPDAVAGFVAKWSDARPEFALALRFLTGPSAPSRIAFACLTFELEHAAFTIADATVAGAKLAWWAEELGRLHEGSPQHPLTRELLGHGASAVPIVVWQDAIFAAMEQRDAGPASDTETLLRGHLALYRPLAVAESGCGHAIDPEAAARAAAVSRAVRACATLESPIPDGSLPLPLDLLARHGLSRHDLTIPGAARAAALHEYLAQLAGSGRGLLAERGLGVNRRTALAADRVRALRAARDAEPLARLQRELSRLPPSALWAAWRGAGRAARG